jgi:hypothetical protein
MLNPINNIINLGAFNVPPFLADGIRCGLLENDWDTYRYDCRQFYISEKRGCQNGEGILSKEPSPN